MEKIIQSHPFYPFFQEITQLRQRASLSLHSNEIQSILNEVHDSFENFFSKHQPYNEHDALLLNGVLTMVAHILEIYEHTLKFETDFIEAWQECYPATWSSLELPSTLKIKKTKRTNHRQEATDLLKAWVLKHEYHPYPDEEQKQVLCQLTELTREQLDHWFINARRRFLKNKTTNITTTS